MCPILFIADVGINVCRTANSHALSVRLTQLLGAQASKGIAAQKIVACRVTNVVVFRLLCAKWSLFRNNLPEEQGDKGKSQ